MFCGMQVGCHYCFAEAKYVGMPKVSHMTTVVRGTTTEDALLRSVFDYCLSETITDEQVQRVLAPVLAMIWAGAFDRPWYERVFFLGQRITNRAHATDASDARETREYKKSG